MAKNGDEPPKKKRRKLTPEHKWILEFLEFYGTDNRVRFCQDDLGGVSLIRIVDALHNGEHVQTEKCDGPGVDCWFTHESDDDVVSVKVWFTAGEMELEIKRARKVKEKDSGPDAA